MNAKQILAANPEGTMTKVSGTFNIEFSNGVVFECKNSKELAKLWVKLQDMGYSRIFNFDSDENEGLAQANELGLESPKATCICSNPQYNF